MKLLLSTLTLLLFISCNGQKNKSAETKEPKVYTDADIVTSSLTDKNENLWFGANITAKGASHITQRVPLISEQTMPVISVQSVPLGYSKISIVKVSFNFLFC